LFYFAFPCANRQIPFAFLEDVKNRFKGAYGNRGQTALAYGMNDEFSRVLARQMVQQLEAELTLPKKKN